MKRIILDAISLEELTDVLRKVVKEEIQNHLPRQPPSDSYLTRTEAAELLRISLPTLHKYSQLGIIKKHKVHNQVRYKQSELEGAMKEIRNNNYCKH